VSQYLLDTHAFLWWLAGSDRLSVTARQAIADQANEIFVSAASAWEIATKYRLGKLPSAELVARDIAGAIADQEFGELPVNVGEAERAGGLPGSHRDPFDRMLIAQSLAHDLAFISNEPLFDRYAVRRLW